MIEKKKRRAVLLLRYTELKLSRFQLWADIRTRENTSNTFILLKQSKQKEKHTLINTRKM